MANTRRTVGGHTQVQYVSWGSRMGGSVCGSICGVLLIVLAIALLAWNEANVVEQANTLDEGMGLVVSVPSNRILDHNEGSLVHVSGSVDTPMLADEDFGVDARGFQLHRVVEMYQAHERVRESRQKDSAGGMVVRKDYEYYMDWSAGLIDSNKFDDPSYSNPRSFPVSAKTVSVKTVSLGAWTLDKHVLSKVTSSRPVSLRNVRLDTRDGKRRSEVVADYLYLERGSFNDPRLGDVRIKWTVTSAPEMSIVGRQNRGTLVPFPTRAGSDILLVATKLVGAEQMFDDAKSANTVMCWVLRVVGFVLMFIAFNLVFAPLATAADVIPCCGRFISAVLSFGTGIVAFVLAAAVSIVTIAIAWLAQRPWLSAILFVAALIPLFGMSAAGKARMVDGKKAT